MEFRLRTTNISGTFSGAAAADALLFCCSVQWHIQGGSWAAGGSFTATIPNWPGDLCSRLVSNSTLSRPPRRLNFLLRSFNFPNPDLKNYNHLILGHCSKLNDSMDVPGRGMKGHLWKKKSICNSMQSDLERIVLISCEMSVRLSFMHQSQVPGLGQFQVQPECVRT